MKRHDELSKGMDQAIVKFAASFARGIIMEGESTASNIFMHQPKEPKDLAKRLQEMSKK